MSESTEPLTDAELAEFESALNAIVWGEGWQYGPNAAADEVERYAAAVALSPDAGEAWRVWVDRGNGDYWNVAFCGNGPTSEAHARLVANAPSIIRALLDALAVERENHTTTRAERDELRSELERY